MTTCFHLMMLLLVCSPSTTLLRRKRSPTVALSLGSHLQTVINWQSLNVVDNFTDPPQGRPVNVEAEEDHEGYNSTQQAFTGEKHWRIYSFEKRLKETSKLENMNILTRPDLVPFCSQCGLMGSCHRRNYWIHFSHSNCSRIDILNFIFQEM